ncbi:MAG: hypothetical protein JKY03_03475, partial [Aureispira sp.]|nr:hypothetical protein [Aureispira sp.]
MKHAKFPPYAELSWLADINAIEVKWNKLYMTLEEFKEITDTVLKMLAI